MHHYNIDFNVNKQIIRQNVCINNTFTSAQAEEASLSQILGQEHIEPFLDFIPLDEINKAISDTKEGKSPGPDGLPIEFYKKYCDIIGPYLEIVYNDIYQTEEMPKDFTEAIIRLIYKLKGKRNEIDNWRPISLLNVDYKILTKLQAARMLSLIHI